MTYSNVPKGEAFTVILCSNPINDQVNPTGQDDVNRGVAKLIINGSELQSPTNSLVYVSRGIQKLTLTAEEMNNNRIDIFVYNITNHYTIEASILIGEIVGTSTQSPAVMTAICKAVNDGYVVSQIATSESEYNYYGLTASNNRWWMIIREKTDFTEIGYKMSRENRKPFLTSWTKRATLNYGDTFPLK